MRAQAKTMQGGCKGWLSNAGVLQEKSDEIGKRDCRWSGAVRLVDAEASRSRMRRWCATQVSQQRGLARSPILGVE